MGIKNIYLWTSALLLGTALFFCSAKNAGAQELIVMESPQYLKCNDSVLVFTPADKAPHATLILLHGWSGCYKDWSNKIDIQAVCNRSGFRIICPDGFYNSWYVNNTDPAKMQARDFFNKEFFPYIFKKFNLNPDSTFIDGLSMGGHGAMNLYIDNPLLFRGAGSMSGVLNLEKGGLKKEFQKVFGEKMEERLKEESASNRISALKGSKKILLISCGYKDFYYPCSEDFADVCKSLGIPYILTGSPAVHSWKFWEFALDQHLFYFQRIIDGKQMGY